MISPVVLCNARKIDFEAPKMIFTGYPSSFIQLVSEIINYYIRTLLTPSDVRRQKMDAIFISPVKYIRR